MTRVNIKIILYICLVERHLYGRPNSYNYTRQGLTSLIYKSCETSETQIFVLCSKARGMNFNFPSKKGTGLERLLPHAPKEAIELIYKLCAYDPEERLSAKQSLRHPYFKEYR